VLSKAMCTGDVDEGSCGGEQCLLVTVSLVSYVSKMKRVLLTYPSKGQKIIIPVQRLSVSEFAENTEKQEC